MHYSVRTLLIGTVLAGGALEQASAQEAKPSDEIVVTATRTGPTLLQDTPVAVTAFNQKMLDQNGIKDVRDLTTLTPNLQVTQNASYAQIYIRGIGSNNVFGGSDPSSTVHLDGVYLGRPSSYLSNFLDVERIEVLRGPQGTLYGRNSVGGTVSIISRKPTNDVIARAQLTYGNYNLARGEAYISGPLMRDKLYASLSLMGTRRDGYLKNMVAGVGDADNERTYGGRAQIRWTPTEDLEMILRADYMKSDDALAGYVKLLQSTTDPVANSVLGDYHKIALNILPASNRRQEGVAGEINYQATPSVAIKSLTAYRSSSLVQVGDTDATSLNIRRTDQYEGQHQFSEELTATGDLGDLTYIAGAYFFDEHIEVRSSVTTFAGNRSSSQPIINTQALAGFGQFTYALGSKFTITAGVRYTRERKDFDQLSNLVVVATGLSVSNYPVTYSRRGIYEAWTPKFMVEYRPVEGVLLYASATKGFKSGGFNFSSANPNQGFAPEQLWSYEAGAKLTLFDRRLLLNTSVFHYDYKNLQVQSFLTPGVVDITNAANARVNGVEIEPTIKVASWLDLGGNLAYLDAQYRDYTSALAAGNIPFDATGNRLNLSPKWSYTAYAQVNVPLSDSALFGRVEYSHRTRQYFTPVNGGLEQQADYGLLNATIGYQFPNDHFEIMLFGRNLTNTDYVTSTASFASGIVGRVGEPRTYGVRLLAKL